MNKRADDPEDYNPKMARNSGRYVSTAWLIGLLTTLVLALGATWASSTSARLTENTLELKSTINKVATLSESARNTNERLDRIENKLDRVLGIGRG